jgi:hypothetical protein
MLATSAAQRAARKQLSRTTGETDIRSAHPVPPGFPANQERVVRVRVMQLDPPITALPKVRAEHVLGLQLVIRHLLMVTGKRMQRGSLICCPWSAAPACRISSLWPIAGPECMFLAYCAFATALNSDPRPCKWMHAYIIQVKEARRLLTCAISPYLITSLDSGAA